MLLALVPILLGAAPIAVCPATGPRHHCVVDGDTVWWHGEKIRLADIDAPEMRGRCGTERRLAVAARDRLVTLLAGQRVTVSRTGRDRYGRTLARLGTPSGQTGELLIREGLASRWPKRRNWCR